MSRSKVSTVAVLGHILSAGVARAHVDMALEEENLRSRFFGTHPEGLNNADFGTPVDLTGAKLDRVVGSSPALSAPYDESHQLKTQGDIYASAADLLSPLPDRLSVNKDSPFYGDYGPIGVRFDGSDRPGDVEEYCVSEGWIRVRTYMKNGKPKRERGKFLCLKKHGVVEPYRK